MSLSLFFCFGKSFTVRVAVKKSMVLKKGALRGDALSIEGAIYAMDSKQSCLCLIFLNLCHAEQRPHHDRRPL